MWNLIDVWGNTPCVFLSVSLLPHSQHSWLQTWWFSTHQAILHDTSWVSYDSFQCWHCLPEVRIRSHNLTGPVPQDGPYFTHQSQIPGCHLYFSLTGNKLGFSWPPPWVWSFARMTHRSQGNTTFIGLLWRIWMHSLMKRYIGWGPEGPQAQELLSPWSWGELLTLPAFGVFMTASLYRHDWLNHWHWWSNSISSPFPLTGGGDGEVWD